MAGVSPAFSWLLSLPLWGQNSPDSGHGFPSTDPFLLRPSESSPGPCWPMGCPVQIRSRALYNKCWSGCGEKRALICCWWECRLVQPLWKAAWRLLKKLRLQLPYDPATPLLGIYPPKLKTFICKDICISMFFASLITVAKPDRQSQEPHDSTAMWDIKLTAPNEQTRKQTEAHRHRQ